MFPIHPAWRYAAIAAAATGAVILTLALGIGLGNPDHPAFRGAAYAGIALALIAFAAAGVGWRLASNSRMRARAPEDQLEASVLKPSDCQWTPDEIERAKTSHEASVPGITTLASAPESTEEAGSGGLNPAGWPRGRLQDPGYLAQQQAENERMSALAESMPTHRQRQLAVQRKVQEDRRLHWGARSNQLLEEGNLPEAMQSILSSAQRALDPVVVRGIAERLVQDVDAYVPPLLLPGSGREVQIMELSVLSDTRIFAGQATRQLASLVERLVDANAELAGRVIGQVGMAASAQASSEIGAIDHDKEEEDGKLTQADMQRALDDLSDGALMEEAINRGLVRIDGSIHPH